MSANTYGLRLLRQPGMQLAALSILAVVVLAFRGLQFVGLTDEIQWGYDFSAYWAAAGRLLDGAGLYTAAQLAGPYAPQQQYLYLYPPPLAAAVIPLTALAPSDYRAAAWIWAGLGLVVLGASVLALWRSERLGERFALLGGSGRWLLIAGALAFPPAIGELVLGNVHLLLLGLLTLAWLGIRRAGVEGDSAAGSRSEWVAGLAVGAAAIIKVFPGLLVVWFLLAGRPRAALASVLGAVAIALVTLPITGIEPWLQYPMVLANLSAPSDTTDTLAPTVWLGEVTGFTIARILVTVAGLAVVAWSGTWLRSLEGSRSKSAAPGARARSFAIAVTVAVLIAPAVYHHYLALLVLPFLLALSAGVRLRWLALAYLLMWGGTQAALGDLAWIVNRAMPTAGALVLLGSLVASRPTAQSAGPDSATSLNRNAQTTG